MKPQVIAVDVDLTLTLNTCWTTEDCLNAQPNQKVIDWVNKQHETNFIVIHTARRHNLYEATIKWLKKHDVHYHAVHMEKLSADQYVDDKSIHPDQLK